MVDLTIGQYDELLKAYGGTRETAKKVNAIFSQGNPALADPEHEAIISGFLQNGAIEGMFEAVNPETLGVSPAPRDIRGILYALVDYKGYEIVAKAKDVGGEMIDVIAKRTGTQQAVVAKVGPALAEKLLGYLERPDTSVWIVDNNRNLFVFSRGPKWEEYMALHESMKTIRDAFRKESLERSSKATVQKEQAATPQSAQKVEKAAAVPAKKEIEAPVPKAPRVPDVPEEEIKIKPAVAVIPAKPIERQAEKSVEVPGEDGDGDEDDPDGDGSDDEDGDEGDGSVYTQKAGDSDSSQAQKRPSFFIGTRKLPRILKEAEVAEMIRISMPMQRDSILLRCMYFLGMSNAEAQNFKVEDIDSVNNTVKIYEGKNRRERTLPVPAEFMNDLKDYIGARPEGYIIHGRDKKANRISDRHIRRIVKGYAKEAGVKNWDEIHPHTLRHSYATHLLDHGTSIEAVQALLGHERLETTAIYSYAHSQAVKEKIENALLSQE